MKQEIIDQVYLLARKREIADALFSTEHPLGLSLAKCEEFTSEIIQNSKYQDLELKNCLDKIEEEDLRKIIALMYYGQHNIKYEDAIDMASIRGRDEGVGLIETILAKSQISQYLYMALSKLMHSGRNVGEL